MIFGYKLVLKIAVFGRQTELREILQRCSQVRELLGNFYFLGVL